MKFLMSVLVAWKIQGLNILSKRFFKKINHL